MENKIKYITIPVLIISVIISAIFFEDIVIPIGLMLLIRISIYLVSISLCKKSDGVIASIFEVIKSVVLRVTIYSAPIDLAQSD